MRALIQRVKRASVRIAGAVHASIGQGLLIFVGIEEIDDQSDIAWLAEKIAGLRLFNDEEGVMNRSVMNIDGELMAISQFTLHASTRKGKRPSYSRAAKPERAEPRYKAFVAALAAASARPVATGVFGAEMAVELVNDGPVTIFIDTKTRE